MKNLKYVLTSLLFIISLLSFSQGRPDIAKIKITGKVVEKGTKQALEYATITFSNPKFPKATSGAITNPKGEFSVEVTPGTYDIKIEFISFKPLIINQKSFEKNTNLGEIILEEDASQLNEVVIRSDKTDIEIKLDKKVYSIGNDLMVKGGTVSDVLNNVPSVSVDSDGTVSLRGNSNVTIFIDGKPSSAIDINEALRLIPADAIDKIEVITNPSARYDAEGAAGILNIILKKGKNQGLNGTIIAASGYPSTNTLSGTLNYKTKKYNLFTNQGYSYRNNPGNGVVETNYLEPKPGSPDYILEKRDNQRLEKSYNGNLGIELYLNKSTSWTNTINYRNTNQNEVDTYNYDNQFFSDIAKNNKQTRVSDDDSKNNNVEYKSSLVKNFKKEGHKLNADVQISQNNGVDSATIVDSQKTSNDFTQQNQKQNKQLYQLDYVLPVGEGGQFEAGYRGSFTDLHTDVTVYNGAVLNTLLTNNLQYIENINALYSQYGFKKNKFSTLFGLRWEDSNIHVNQFTENDLHHKKYNNFFPSAFLTYQLDEESSLSLNYSRRITRPRGRFINPFSNYSSAINIFQGNPDLNPSMTDAVDFGYLRKWGNFIVTSSIYTNRTTAVFLLARIDSGDEVGGVPVVITVPVNVTSQYRTGFEFNVNYSPYKWWKLNTNFNLFDVDTNGGYMYKNNKGQVFVGDLSNNTSSWSAKLNSKVTLPNKIDWQTNMTYNGSQKTAQGKNLGIFAMNLGFSKDIIKDKGTLAFGINDVFNSRKMKTETYIQTPQPIKSYSELQFRQRQFMLSYTYRFNKPKNERERQRPNAKDPDNGGDDLLGN